MSLRNNLCMYKYQGEASDFIHLFIYHWPQLNSYFALPPKPVIFLVYLWFHGIWLFGVLFCNITMTS